MIILNLNLGPENDVRISTAFALVNCVATLPSTALQYNNKVRYMLSSILLGCVEAECN